MVDCKNVRENVLSKISMPNLLLPDEKTNSGYTVSIFFLNLNINQCIKRVALPYIKLLQMKKRVPHFGSFYLRVGAISFGIGTMVYSGLEFGQYFEMNSKLKLE